MDETQRIHPHSTLRCGPHEIGQTQWGQNEFGPSARAEKVARSLDEIMKLTAEFETGTGAFDAARSPAAVLAIKWWIAENPLGTVSSSMTPQGSQVEDPWLDPVIETIARNVGAQIAGQPILHFDRNHPQIWILPGRTKTDHAAACTEVHDGRRSVIEREVAREQKTVQAKPKALSRLAQDERAVT